MQENKAPEISQSGFSVIYRSPDTGSTISSWASLRLEVPPC
jgi:hypothetical protein